MVSCESCDKKMTKTSDNEAITEGEFKAYENVRSSGIVNMWDVSSVSKLTGLPREKLFKIMKEYTELRKKFKYFN